ncbi:MAG: site-specific integrase [Bacteroides sp.]|nr:site-specific integrase [Bacteroides sp.]MCM1531428.1 site-specific integrase [Ruminococcus flavefaciens]MCM1554410.1 site-specific integrase [Bacteroides sp.]
MDINFYLTTTADKQGDCGIRVSVATQGVRLLTSTGYKINPKMWEKPVQRVRRGAVNAKGMPSNIINAGLDNIRAHFGRLDDISRSFTLEELRQEFLSCTGKKGRKAKETEKDGITVSDAIKRFVVDSGNRNGWTMSTVQKFNTLSGHLARYSPGLKLKDLDRDCISGLVLYYLNKNFTNSTIAKQINQLKWFLRWAEDHDYVTASDWKKFSAKLKQPEKTIVFLDWDELMRVYDCEIPEEKQYLVRVRDVFCFCCFTGLRYSDVANLHRSDVYQECIRVTTIKTADTLEIELNDYAKTILQKYEGEHYPGDLALPVISGQRMNEYLRELGELAGLDTPIRQVYYSGSERIEEVRPKYEYLTTHCGRRTFICNALALGIPVDVVMRWTGHSDYSAMKPYIAIADKVKAEEMKKFNKK